MATQTATHAIGKDVDSWCTKCNLILAHTVEAMVGNKITKVHCNTCGGQHAYRASKPGTRAAGGTGARRSSSEKAKPSPAEQYATLMKNRDPHNARAYATSGRFSIGDLISHTVFGLGVVTLTKDHNKIEVIFGEGPRTLLHGK